MPPDDLAFSPFARALIRRKARRLAAGPGFTVSDRPDLEQELTVRVWRARFDPARGHPHAFVATVVERAAAGLARRARAGKRDPRRVDPVRADGGFDPPDPRDPGMEVARADLAADIARVVAGLPPDLRRLADRLTRMTLAEAARVAGVRRSTLQRHAAKLAARLRAAGLGDSG